ncbi:MAG: pteridine reductase [Cellvibrionales bacterium TMED148]|nr:pteridine reductase [Porticoccaceae bacterium]RPG90708.1 MAG: pteridine reductase [Cellvibrionales bacterium TMED148]
MESSSSDCPVVLVTGAAQRIGAAVSCRFHESGYKTVIHFNRSQTEAEELNTKLNDLRPDSAFLVQGDLNDERTQGSIFREVAKIGRLDVLVNNASSFYPTPLEMATESQWNDLINSNLKGPFFLCKRLAEMLTQNLGSIINLADIHAYQALKKHPIYTVAKAGNIAMTKSLALELAPHVRVNGVSPGAILWPQHELDDTQKHKKVLEAVPMGKLGSEADIAECVFFLAAKASYMTGQTISVDGGASHSI